MPRRDDTVLDALLADAQYARDVAAVMQEQERAAVVSFIDCARTCGWPWSRIGKALNISDNAAHSYYERNRVAQ